jgi:hypothetical protein
MKREETAETGSPTLTKSLSALEDEAGRGALAANRRNWNELCFDPWESDQFPLATVWP